MGLKEDLITNWEHKYITYQDAELFVVKQFEYEGVTYLYAIDTASAEDNSDDLKTAFLYKVKDSIYANVDDDNLYNELLGQVAGELTVDMLKNVLNK